MAAPDLGFVDGLAQGGAAGDAVGEPGGELLHLAGGFGGGRARGVGGKLGEQHLEVGADHAVAVLVGGQVVAAGGGVLRDLAEDPWIGGRGAADHHGVAAGLGDQGAGVFGGADVAIADDGDADGVFDLGDVVPAGLAGVALLAGAGVERDGVEAAVFGELRERDADDVVVVPAEAELDGERNCNRGAHGTGRFRR